MKRTEFMKMKEYKDFLEDKDGKKSIDKKMTNELEKGDFFLYGTNMIGQKQNKEIGQDISYYQVIKKTKFGVEYGFVFDTLEEDKGEKK